MIFNDTLVLSVTGFLWSIAAYCLCSRPKEETRWWKELHGLEERFRNRNDPEWKAQEALQKRRLQEKSKVLTACREWNPFAGRREEKRDLELAETASFLRNIVAGSRQGDEVFLPGLDSLLEELADRKGILAPAFAAMLRHLRENRKTEALEAFTRIAGEREGKDLGRLMLEWDRLSPEELTETLLSYQKHLSEMRFTLQKKRDETLSDLLYLPVVLNVVLIFLNFIYVGYFMEQTELLQLLK